MLLQFRKNKQNEKLENKLEEIQKEYEIFKEPNKIWKELNTLDTESKEYLKKLCGNFNPVGLIILGGDINRIEQLWEYLKDLSVKAENKNKIEKISNCYEYCLNNFKFFNTNEDKITLFEIKEGDDFDIETCIRTSNSKQIGSVQKTIVKGVKKNENILFKAIVEVQ